LLAISQQSQDELRLRFGNFGLNFDIQYGGVSQATVYSYFADKEGLFAALVQRLAREKVYPRSPIPKCDRQNLGIFFDNYLNAIKSEIPLWLRSQVLVRCFS